MNESTTALLAGLGGAIIGATAALGAQWLANKAQAQAERRRTTVDLVAKFWEIAERLFLAAVDVRVELNRLLDAGVHPDDDAHLNELLDVREGIDVEGRFFAAQMRLLRLPVAEHAERVLKTTRFYDGEKPGQPEARAQAIRDYEDTAAKLLDSLN